MELNLSTFAPVLRALGAGVAPALETALTTILTGVAGPFGMLVGPGLNLIWPQINAALGLAPDTPPDVTAAKIEADPDAARAQLATLDADHTFQLTVRDKDTADQAQQIEVTKTEAASEHWLQWAWRPMLCWTLGANLALILMAPWLVYFFAVIGHALPPPPAVNFDLTVTMVSALLGLGTLRTVDRFKAPSTTTVKAKK